MTESYLNSSVCGAGHLSHSPPITHACNHETLIIPESYTISVFDNSVKNVGTVWEQKLRPGGRASSRSLAGRHGLIYGMEAGRFKYWAGGVVAPGKREGVSVEVPLPSHVSDMSGEPGGESGPAQNIHKTAGGPFGIAGGLFYWRRIMELSDAGRKVWERSYHPLYANNLGDGDTFVSDPGVPFGWVVAKDVLAALITEYHGYSITELALDARYQAIALCNTLAKEGL